MPAPPTALRAELFGIVDLLALLPTYLALFFPELHVLIDVRVLRLMRIFRIFKLTAYMSEYRAWGRRCAPAQDHGVSPAVP